MGKDKEPKNLPRNTAVKLKSVVVEMELQGNDVATVLDSGDRLGRTPLHYAASQKTGPNKGWMEGMDLFRIFTGFCPRSLIHLQPTEGRGEH